MRRCSRAGEGVDALGHAKKYGSDGEKMLAALILRKEMREVLKVGQTVGSLRSRL